MLRSNVALLTVAVSGIAVLAASPAFAKTKAEPEASAKNAKAQGAEPAAPAAAVPATNQRFDIDEFRIDGADNLPQIAVEEAVYPFLGPERTADDVEKARAALEKKYHDQGYQTVNVAVPAQNVASRVVVLTVTEGKIGRLRVTNARYYDIEKIKKKAPSLQEGTLPNFDQVTKDIVALNQMPDRRVTPALRAGVTPGTVDVDLNVEDTLPFHGSLEFNNRQSPNTTATRLNATVKYDNLWQLGHSASLSFQIAPERPDDATVFSGSYLARLTDWTSLLVYGVDSKSDVATVGGMNVVGPGQVFGIRGILTLPAREEYFHSFSFGFDYKHFGQTVTLANDSFSSPITYYPISASYGGTWQKEGSLTQFNIGATFNMRGPGSDFDEFWTKRAYSESNFFHLNADLSHRQDLKHGFQLFGQVKGQLADTALVSSEQFSVGGADTVRGYYESETIGDNGVVASLELISPDLGLWLQNKPKDEKAQPATWAKINEWRVFGFLDGGIATIHDPLPEQESSFKSWSVGLGTRFKVFDHLSGAVTLAVPLEDQGETGAGDPRALFNLTGEF